LILAIVRVIAFWSEDPMLAYANNYDKIRSMRVFGLQPRNSQKPLYAGTPEQPWRYFKKTDSWHRISYFSSDLSFKLVQYMTMRIFKQRDGSMDIKVGTIPILLGLFLGIGYIFFKAMAKPFAAMGFALWILLIFDPVNLLFLNTWYLEFSAFAVTVLLVGTAWLWFVDLISTRSVIGWGSAWLFIIALNRNQYMFILLAILPLGILIIHQAERLDCSFFRTKKLTIAIIIIILPILIFGSKFGQLESTNNANRVDTVFGALLSATNDEAGMVKDLGLSYDCTRFVGKNWYTISHTDLYQYCPKVMKLPLWRIGLAVAKHPMAVYTIIETISTNHRGFLLKYLGQIEGSEFKKISDQHGFTYVSADQLLTTLPSHWINMIILICAIGPGIAGIMAWFMGKFRLSMMFMLNFIIFNYILIASILGDGYIEIERHTMLCFSFGILFFIFMLFWCGVGMHKLFLYFIGNNKNSCHRSGNNRIEEPCVPATSPVQTGRFGTVCRKRVGSGPIGGEPTTVGRQIRDLQGRLAY
jgi:hypothetical protein